ncbi:MAG: carboxypeptidase regulatory-like domain-containing protein [Acidobacteriota bacterium]|nr:carboxypeptidase regulatory-like domain-containing protein [Blastocatellia bacterium]MDW8412283.1 carboxypeptidase regulatory-like domain-containing protein [Acidobacteriota bacterium]
MRVVGLFLFVFVLFVGNVFSQSQATMGLIQGNVFDPDNAAVAGARVVATNLDTGFQREATTEGSGHFTIPLLPVGKYKVQVEANGFNTIVRENIELVVGQTLTLTFELTPSATQEIVTITAEPPLVEVGRGEQSTLLDKRSVDELPINSRDFSSFIKLSPGVSVVQGPDGDELTINGQKGIHNNLSIDGSDANNPFFGEQRGGQRPKFTISLESVKEFQVVTFGAAPEFGRSSGAFINVVTKSGTNEFKGSTFFFFRDQKLTSQNIDAVRAGLPQDDFSNYQFGGNLGGPIKKNKAFFFFAYDQNEGTSTKPNSVDPRLVQIFATRFNSPNEQGQIERTNDAIALLAKVDWVVTPRNYLTIRHNYSKAKQINGTFDVPTWGRSANGREENNTNAFITQLVSTVSPTFLNEFRFQFARENRPRFYDGPDLPDTTIGTFAGDISYRFGRPFFLPVPLVDRRIQFTNNLSLIRGNHSLKFGFDYNYTRAAQVFIGFARGRYIFAGPTIDAAIKGFVDYIDRRSVDGLAFYLQFAPLGGRTVEEAGSQVIVNHEPAFYGQDSWKIRPNLTINYGLRWEGQFFPEIISPISQTRYGQFIGDPRFPSDGTIPDFTDGWQPRFSFAYDPANDGKTVIRGSAGIFYARIPGLVQAGPRNTDGAISGNIFFAGFLAKPPINVPVSAFPVYPGIVSTKGFVPFNPGVRVFDRNFRNPRTVQCALGIERELATDLSFSVTFNYALATRLTRYIDRNDPLLYGGVAVFSRPDGSGVGEVATTESSARSLFRGITFVVNKRYSKRFQFQANYLLSWDFSDDDNERDPFTFRYADINNLKLEYNYSDRDQRHRFNFFGVYNGPYGINITAIFQGRSAQPDSVPGRGPGTTIKRNTLRKENAFTSLDLRFSKVFKVDEVKQLEFMAEIFNIFNSRNLISIPRPLTFNFDGTVRSGFGEPRQAQLGVRFRF